MRAAVLHRPKVLTMEDVQSPMLEQPTDAIVRVVASSMGGAELTIYNGMVPYSKPVIMGHEFMGVVVDVGPAVQRVRPGDRVAVPCPISCGVCWFCTHDLPVHCENSNDNYGPDGGSTAQRGGGRFGFTELYGGYAGGQAEYVRVPFADVGARRVPDELTDEQALLVTSSLPAGYSAIQSSYAHGGDAVAVIGCGPIGLMAMKCAWLHGAAKVFGVDRVPDRLAAARRAANAQSFCDGPVDAVEEIRAATGGRGADIVIEAVGMSDPTSNPADALATAARAVRRAGILVILGDYFGAKVQLPLAQLHDKCVRIVLGQAPVHRYIDECINLVTSGMVRIDDVITHRLPFHDTPRAYEMLDRKEDGCVKVLLTHA